MQLLYTLTDNEFPYDGINHVRDICRGIIYNDKLEIALIKIKGDDIFGHRDYYETPGGGKEKGETYRKALIREIKEELGYLIDSIKEIGLVVDYYNLLKRENHTYYFLAHAKEKCESHQTIFEKKMFEGIVWIPYQKVVEEFNSVPNTPISKIVKNRELPILEIVTEYFDLLPSSKG